MNILFLISKLEYDRPCGVPRLLSSNVVICSANKDYGGDR